MGSLIVRKGSVGQWAQPGPSVLEVAENWGCRRSHDRQWERSQQPGARTRESHLSGSRG